MKYIQFSQELPQVSTMGIGCMRIAGMDVQQAEVKKLLAKSLQKILLFAHVFFCNPSGVSDRTFLIFLKSIFWNRWMVFFQDCIQIIWIHYCCIDLMY